MTWPVCVCVFVCVIVCLPLSASLPCSLSLPLSLSLSLPLSLFLTLLFFLIHCSSPDNSYHLPATVSVPSRKPLSQHWEVTGSSLVPSSQCSNTETHSRGDSTYHRRLLRGGRLVMMSGIKWSGEWKWYGNHVFDTIQFIPLQPLLWAHPPQIRCHQPPVEPTKHR